MEYFGHSTTDNNVAPAVSELQPAPAVLKTVAQSYTRICSRCKGKIAFGSVGEAPVRCARHRLPSDVRRDRPACIDDCSVCGATASYGFPGKARRRCFLHKLDGMENKTKPRNAATKLATQLALQKAGVEPNPGPSWENIKSKAYSTANWAKTKADPGVAWAKEQLGPVKEKTVEYAHWGAEKSKPVFNKAVEYSAYGFEVAKSYTVGAYHAATPYLSTVWRWSKDNAVFAAQTAYYRFPSGTGMKEGWSKVYLGVKSFGVWWGSSIHGWFTNHSTKKAVGGRYIEAVRIGNASLSACTAVNAQVWYWNQAYAKVIYNFTLRRDERWVLPGGHYLSFGFYVEGGKDPSRTTEGTEEQFQKDLTTEGVEPNPGPPKVTNKGKHNYNGVPVGKVIACTFHRKRGVTGTDCAACLKVVTSEIQRQKHSFTRQKKVADLVSTALKQAKEEEEGSEQGLLELRLDEATAELEDLALSLEKDIKQEVEVPKAEDVPAVDLAKWQKALELELNLPSTEERWGKWNFHHKDRVRAMPVFISACSVFATSFACFYVAGKYGPHYSLVRFNGNYFEKRVRLFTTAAAIASFYVAVGSALTAVYAAYRWAKCGYITYRKHLFEVSSVDDFLERTPEGKLIDHRPENVRKLPVKYAADLGQATYSSHLKIFCNWVRFRKPQTYLVAQSLFRHSQSSYTDDVTVAEDIRKERNIKSMHVMPVDFPSDAQFINQTIPTNTLWLRLNWLRAQAQQLAKCPFPGASADTGIT